jgi:hypothetical protein
VINWCFSQSGLQGCVVSGNNEAGQLLDLGMIILEDEILDQQRSLILFENELTDDNSGSESTSGLLQSSRDAFQQAAAFNWGQARFGFRD